MELKQIAIAAKNSIHASKSFRVKKKNGYRRSEKSDRSMRSAAKIEASREYIRYIRGSRSKKSGIEFLLTAIFCCQIQTDPEIPERTVSFIGLTVHIP
ncbi:MAG TPA: hypothetical protein VIN77_06360 [Aurantimonas sp.]